MLFVAILSLVVSGPLVVVRMTTFALNRVDRGPDTTPDWWSLWSTLAIPVFVAALAFVIWDSYRIGRREEAGIRVSGLRVPPPRRQSRRRRIPRGLR